MELLLNQKLELNVGYIKVDQGLIHTSMVNTYEHNDKLHWIKSRDLVVWHPVSHSGQSDVSLKFINRR